MRIKYHNLELRHIANISILKDCIIIGNVNMVKFMIIRVLHHRLLMLGNFIYSQCIEKKFKNYYNKWKI